VEPLMTASRTTSFVGRERELIEMDGILEEAANGRGRLVLISGPPGIGKTRFADQVADHARRRGMVVAWGRCWEGAGAPAYWPWVQAFRALFRSATPAEIHRVTRSGAAELTQLMPELDGLQDHRAAPTTDDPDAARFMLFDAAASWLRVGGGDAGLLVIIDDLHAADTASLLMLLFVAGQLEGARIVVLTTHRDVELVPESELVGMLNDLRRMPTTASMRLEGLPEEATQTFIEEAAGFAPRTGLVTALHRETAGNPLFLGEAVRLLASEGRFRDTMDLAGLHLAVPAGVRDVIARRIRQVGDQAVAVIEIASVLGPEFDLQAVVRAGKLESDSADDIIGELVHANLAVEVPGFRHRFRFAHPLIRETVYDALAPIRRQRLHRRCAEALEELHAGALDLHLAELAQHWYSSAQDGADARRAADYARRAGTEAAQKLAYEQSAALFALALQALAEQEEVDESLRCELLIDMGDALSRGGDLLLARTAFLDAAASARIRGDAHHLADAALGYGGRLVWARAGHDRELVPLLEEALGALDDADLRLRIRLLARLACALRSDPDRQRADDPSRQAVDLARQFGDPALLGYALSGRYGAIWWPENADERLALGREIEDVAVVAGDAERIIDGQIWQYVALVDLCRMQEASVLLGRLEASAHALRQPSQAWLVSVQRTIRHLLEGNWEEAERRISVGLRPGRPSTPVLDDVSSSRMHQFLLRREQARAPELDELIRDAVEAFPWYPMFRSALACLLIEAGRAGEARIVFDALAADDFQALHRDNEWLLGMALAAEACCLLGDRKAGDVLYRQLLPFAGLHAYGPTEGAIGAVDRYLGLLADLLGRDADAAAHLRSAIRLNDGMQARPYAAHARRELARVLARSPEGVQQARELLAEAQRSAEAIGMQSLLSRLSTETALAASDERRPPPQLSTFRRDGDYWTVEFHGERAMIRDAKGMGYLAALLASPRVEHHALQLAGGIAIRGRQPGSSRALEGLHAAAGLGDSGDMLDAEAKKAYRQRADDLRADIAEAEDWNDTERAQRSQRELDFLASELGRAVGLGGRDRRAASSSERARLSVTRAIRSAVRRIAGELPALGAHLDESIRTGTFCSYQPESSSEPRWST
jgi:predicted ATPase